eukprot:SM000196S05375  [mRNA]  locus=s196:152294:155665:- [translate_table: standard]
MEDYGFEYSDEEQEEQDVDIENQYYNSKGLPPPFSRSLVLPPQLLCSDQRLMSDSLRGAGLVENDPDGALAGFADVVRMEGEKGEGFKALKQTVKLHYRLGHQRQMMGAYREMLTYIRSAVTRNYSEKCINNILDYVSGAAGAAAGPAAAAAAAAAAGGAHDGGQSLELLQEFYQTTLRALEEAKNEASSPPPLPLSPSSLIIAAARWLSLQLHWRHAAAVVQDQPEAVQAVVRHGRVRPHEQAHTPSSPPLPFLPRVAQILKELYRSCQKEDGSDDQKKGTQLLEVYAIEIQMYTETKNTKKLKELYQRALAIKSAIPHPRIMGIIRECGGKMYMAERQWADAATNFFEAFKAYDESGTTRRIQCLKYVVLAYMLMEPEVNPFDAQEAKPYKTDAEILAMTNLVAAYQRNEILEFEKILKENRATIMDDPFIRNHIEDLLKNIRTQVLLKLIKPYTRIRIPFVSKELNIPEKDVEQLLVSLILDNRVHGHIDQVKQLLELGDRSKGLKKYGAVDKWTVQLRSLHQTVINKLSA